MAVRFSHLGPHVLAVGLTAMWIRAGAAPFIELTSSFLSGGSWFLLTGTAESSSLDQALVTADHSTFSWVAVATITAVTAIVSTAVIAVQRRAAVKPLLPLGLAFGAMTLGALPFVLSRFPIADDLTAPMVVGGILLWIFASSFIVYWCSAQAVVRLGSRP